MPRCEMDINLKNGVSPAKSQREPGHLAADDHPVHRISRRPVALDSRGAPGKYLCARRLSRAQPVSGTMKMANPSCPLAPTVCRAAAPGAPRSAIYSSTSRDPFDAGVGSNGRRPPCPHGRRCRQRRPHQGGPDAGPTGRRAGYWSCRPSMKTKSNFGRSSDSIVGRISAAAPVRTLDAVGQAGAFDIGLGDNGHDANRIRWSRPRLPARSHGRDGWWNSPPACRSRARSAPGSCGSASPGSGPVPRTRYGAAALPAPAISSTSARHRIVSAEGHRRSSRRHRVQSATSRSITNSPQATDLEHFNCFAETTQSSRSLFVALSNWRTGVHFA